MLLVASGFPPPREFNFIWLWSWSPTLVSHCPPTLLGSQRGPDFARQTHIRKLHYLLGCLRTEGCEDGGTAVEEKTHTPASVACSGVFFYGHLGPRSAGRWPGGTILPETSVFKSSRRPAVTQRLYSKRTWARWECFLTYRRHYRMKARPRSTQ